MPFIDVVLVQPLLIQVIHFAVYMLQIFLWEKVLRTCFVFDLLNVFVKEYFHFRVFWHIFQPKVFKEDMLHTFFIQNPTIILVFQLELCLSQKYRLTHVVDESWGNKASWGDQIGLILKPLLGDYKHQPEQRLHERWVSWRRGNFLESVDKLVIKCHGELELFQTDIDLLLNCFVLDCDDFEHFFHMVDEIFEIIIFLYYFVYR